MSIINDALKKAGKANSFFVSRPGQKKYWLWIGLGVFLFFGVIFAVNSLRTNAGAKSLSRQVGRQQGLE